MNTFFKPTQFNFGELDTKKKEIYDIYNNMDQINEEGISLGSSKVEMQPEDFSNFINTGFKNSNLEIRLIGDCYNNFISLKNPSISTSKISLNIISIDNLVELNFRYKDMRLIKVNDKLVRIQKDQTNYINIQKN